VGLKIGNGNDAEDFSLASAFFHQLFQFFEARPMSGRIRFLVRL